MEIYVGKNGHHMILSHFFSCAMYVIKGMEIYIGQNKHCESSYKMQSKFNYFYAHPSTRM